MSRDTACRASKACPVLPRAPRVAPDGESVLYTSDRGGYGNLYSAPLPQTDAAFLALPLA